MGAKAEKGKVKTCQKCQGNGEVLHHNSYQSYMLPCDICGGSGKIFVAEEDPADVE
jgi:DnaJ-class molecular chaperone